MVVHLWEDGEEIIRQVVDLSKVDLVEAAVEQVDVVVVKGGGGGYTGGGIRTSTDSGGTKEALAGGGNYVILSLSNRTYSGLRNAGESGFVTITKL